MRYINRVTQAPEAPLLKHIDQPHRTSVADQIAGYVKGLKKEYPEAQISQFVIYCEG